MRRNLKGSLMINTVEGVEIEVESRNSSDEGLKSARKKLMDVNSIKPSN